MEGWPSIEVMKKKTIQIQAAAICLKTDEGLKTISVDNEGNPGAAGAKLYAKYQTKEKVEKLIALGDLYELQESLTPSPSIGHYILKDENGVENKCLQEGVCIAKERDVRQIRKGKIKRGKKKPYRLYGNEKLAYICEGVSVVYVFDADKGVWSTYTNNFNSGVFEEIKINYVTLIRNLIYRDELSPLTEEEKERLSYL